MRSLENEYKKIVAPTIDFSIISFFVSYFFYLIHSEP